MAERFGQPPGVTQGDIGARYTRKRLGDEVYVGHYIKAGDRIRVRATILTGVIASLTTVNLTIGGRVQGMDGELVPFGDSFTFSADGVQTARYFLAPEGYVIDLIVESTSTGLTSGDLTVIVDIMQGVGSSAVAVGLLAYGYVYPAGLLGLNVSRNIGGGSGGGMAIGGTVTSGTAGDLLYVGAGPVLAQSDQLKWRNSNLEVQIGSAYTEAVSDSVAGVAIGADVANGNQAALSLSSSFSAQGEPLVTARCGRGTIASPTVSTNNDRLLTMAALGYTSTGVFNIAVQLGVAVDGVPAAGLIPGRFSVISQSNDDGPGVLRERLRVTSVGTVDLATPSANTSVAITGQLEVQSSVVLHKGVTFANLPGTPVAGMVAYITDSNAFLWGATIAGGSTNKVLGWYNGTNWTVAGA